MPASKYRWICFNRITRDSFDIDMDRVLAMQAAPEMLVF